MVVLKNLTDNIIYLHVYKKNCMKAFKFKSHIEILRHFWSYKIKNFTEGFCFISIRTQLHDQKKNPLEKIRFQDLSSYILQ
jgi:hypothetical protein